MNRKQCDILVGALIAVVVVFGLISSVQFLLADDPGMGHMDPVPALHFVGPLFGSLLVASVIAGSYVIVRDRLLVEPGAADTASMEVNVGLESAGEEDPIAEIPDSNENATSSRLKRHPILDVVPEDEEKILEPVIVSPGITQVEVCDRSGFSRSKVSQTITDIEKRGLVYRERQGRTYRVYPADDLDERVRTG